MQSEHATNALNQVSRAVDQADIDATMNRSFAEPKNVGLFSKMKMVFGGKKKV